MSGAAFGPCPIFTSISAVPGGLVGGFRSKILTSARAYIGGGSWVVSPEAYEWLDAWLLEAALLSGVEVRSKSFGRPLIAERQSELF